ncbi:hypothetical protein BREVUG8_10010 [Brevundimonas sp. G8]|nr:hypothetical protein BREVUG8_10010 [Brevundimonas sp. G8]
MKRDESDTASAIAWAGFVTWYSDLSS